MQSIEAPIQEDDSLDYFDNRLQPLIIVTNVVFRHALFALHHRLGYRNVQSERIQPQP